MEHSEPLMSAPAEHELKERPILLDEDLGAFTSTGLESKV